MSLMVPLPSSKYSQEIANYIFKEEEDEDDICISNEGFYNDQSPKSPMQKEKQISVDPISLQQTVRHVGLPLLPPSLPPSKHKFISASLPGSTTVSPPSHTKKNVKKWRNHQAHASPPPISPLHRHPSLGLSRFAIENQLDRSKSCAVGRASATSDDFDLFSRTLCSPKHHEKIENDNNKAKDDQNPESNKDDDFKCGSCLFLPAFGRGKQVRAQKEEVVAVERNVISRTVSLEKFECGSWSSSAMMYEDDDVDEEGKSMVHQLYFDLPLELIKNCGNDTNSPERTAFIFDRDRNGGAITKSSTSITATRKAYHESSRHDRFITTSGSPGSCITPRLRKARDDFNAFLQAQNA